MEFTVKGCKLLSPTTDINHCARAEPGQQSWSRVSLVCAGRKRTGGEAPFPELPPEGARSSRKLRGLAPRAARSRAPRREKPTGRLWAPPLSSRAGLSPAMRIEEDERDEEQPASHQQVRRTRSAWLGEHGIEILGRKRPPASARPPFRLGGLPFVH